MTFHAIDESGNNLQNAVVTILKEVPLINDYITLTQLTTNSEGKVTKILNLDDTFYKALVDYQGARVFASTQPFTISTNDDTIILPCIIGETYTDYYDTLFGTTVTLTYNNITKTTGSFTGAYAGTRSVEMCLTTDIVNITGITEVDKVCQNGTSGSLTTAVFTPTNLTLYCCRSELDFKDGYGFRYATSKCKLIGETVGGVNATNTTRELLMVLGIPPLLGSFGFVASPVTGLFTIGALYIGEYVILNKVMQRPLLSMTALMIILSLITLSIITISRVKK